MELGMKSNVMSTLVAACAAVVLAGCVSSTPPALEGRPPAYVQGYKDGCASGKSVEGSVFYTYQKNIYLFESDKDYKEGWNDAYRQCRSKQETKDASGGSR
jgi:hypothetical protein